MTTRAKTRKLKGTYDKTSSRIGFHNWNLHTDPAIEKMLADMMEKMLKDAFAIANDYVAYGEFAISWWDGKGKTPDADQITIDLPLGPFEDDSPRWKFSLQEMVREVININSDRDDGPLNPGARRIVEAVRANMLEAVGLLDEALAREKKP